MTGRQRRILQAILHYKEQHDYPPALGDVAELLGISKSTAWYGERSLKAEGYLGRDGFGGEARRCLRVLKLPYRLIKPPYTVLWQMVNGRLVYAPRDVPLDHQKEEISVSNTE